MSVASAESAQGRPAARRPRARRALALVFIAALLVAVVAAAAGYLWLRSYAPIRMAGTSGPGPASGDVQVVRHAEEFGGRTAYVVSGDQPVRFGAFFDVTNTGPLPVTIEGLADLDRDSLFPPLKLHGGVAADGSRFLDFRPFTLDGGETAFLGLEVVATTQCQDFVPGGSIGWESVSLRYSYARFFEREATIQMPVAMSLVC